MRVRWHGHSCFEIIGHVTIVTDPHDGKSLGIKPPSAEADIVLISHDHSDHNSFMSITGYRKIVFAFVGGFDFEGIKFTGLQTDHDDAGGKKRGKNVMYSMTIDGISICHCGDLGKMPDENVIEKIKGTDILMVPVGGIQTMDVEELIRFIDTVDPRVIVPMHYRIGGLSMPINSVDAFLDAMNIEAEQIGDEIDLSADELPAERTIWMFSR
ncbi:MAG: MBL fold metallo-hydrolase [Methanomassiliicoccaceae archaeon]|nr:MBL fold metallo-hydrolase [Methanomassiliicoccaceae archaeon]